MTEIISVRFKTGGKQYFFDPQGEKVKTGQGVIVETSRGNEFGECVRANFELPDEKVPRPLRILVRLASEKDFALVEKNRQREQWAHKVCMEKINHHKLDMKLVGVEYSFEGNKVLFFFTADGRVDFRSLVKDLAATIHARIELRQIGVRDEAKMIGGLGICGRAFCCNQFLDKFQPVSIKMAKTQSLSLNPTKISGTCGRLMCCLQYEQDAYEDLLKKTPRSDSFVETPDGAGTIASVNLLRQQVAVRLESDSSVAKKYHNTEIVVVRSGKGRRPEGYVQPPLAELEKQRRVVEQMITERPTGVNTLASTLEAILNPPPPQKPKQRYHDKRHDGNYDGKNKGKPKPKEFKDIKKNNNNQNQNPNRPPKSGGKDENGKPQQKRTQNRGNRPPKNKNRQSASKRFHEGDES